MNDVIKRKTYLSFAIGVEIFAIEITHVLEVVFVSDITPVPNAPTHVMGVVNFRGHIIPVYDIRAKLNVDVAPLKALDVFIIVEVELNGVSQRLALIASKVYEVFETTETAISPVSSNYKKYDTRILAGMTKIKDQFIMIINPDEIIQAEELVANNS